MLPSRTLQASDPQSLPAVGLLLWLLLATTAACFWPALSGPFVFDDFPNLQNLAQLGGRVDRTTIGAYLFSFLGNPGRPLAALSFLIEDASWPTSPDAFKHNNLFFHLLVGCFIFLLAQSVARLRGLSSSRVAWIALACTAMWLLHPMQLSATMLVVQRMAILSALFVVCGLLLYLKVLFAASIAEFWRVVLAGATLGVFGLLAFLCKENGVLIFGYACVLNLTMLAEHVDRFRSGTRRLLLWGTASPMLVLMLVPLAHPQSVLAAYDLRDFTLTERLLTECRILLEYLFSILLPRIGGQGIFHDDYVVSRSLFDPWATAPAVIVVLALVASAIWFRRKAPLFGFATLWFFTGHLIESTVVALELYFEHRNYLPMVGPLFALAYCAVISARRYTIAANAILAVWLCTAALSTRLNAPIWGDRGRLALVWAHQSPQSPRAVQMLAAYYADQGDIGSARKVFDAGIVRLPARVNLRIQRRLLDCIDRGLEPGQWQDVLRSATKPGYDRALPDLASSFVRQVTEGGCKGTLVRGNVRALIETLLANPSYSDADSKGFLHYELSRLALAEKDLDGLMRHMDLSNHYRPNPLVAREQAIYLLSAGLPREALQYLDRSENAPIPWFKRWLLDMPSRNASLRQSADRMLEAQLRAR